MNLELRPATDQDQAFLYSVYASTRSEEMALVRWDNSQQEAFLRMQFNAQRSSYAMQFPNAEHSIIVLNGRAAGRMIVDRSGAQILLIDIALLPEFRASGVGSILMNEMLAEATVQQRPVTLHVEKFNRALRLYKRLGFIPISDSGLYIEMVWRPEKIAAAG